MADVDHPKTHVEDQDLDKPRKQPESPKHEGIDPLTESDTMYPAEDVKGGAERAAKKEAKVEGERADAGEPTDDQAAQADTVADQKHVEADTRSADELAEDTEPGKADDPTPDAGEKAEDQEPHTDADNTSPANRTKSSKK